MPFRRARKIIRAARQQHLHRRTVTQFHFYDGRAAGLFNEAGTIDKPSPLPLPGSFVVKKGSKTFFRISFSMPAPVSVTEADILARQQSGMRAAILLIESFVDVPIVRRPPCGMASRALIAKF